MLAGGALRGRYRFANPGLLNERGIIPPPLNAGRIVARGTRAGAFAAFAQHSANVPSHSSDNVGVGPAYLCFRPETEERAREGVFNGLQMVASGFYLSAPNLVGEIQERTGQQEMRQPNDEHVIAFLSFHGGSHHKTAGRSIVEPDFGRHHGSCGVASLVASGRMKMANAEREIATMEAIAADYRVQAAAEKPDLFAMGEGHHG
ncbi:hypothetical protein [Methylobacterium soli]|uniref:Uncharacterized protein n=1 Tax=Methylobacterium soli TaxID=553447 RepID=A0A6L3SRR0_9HYPH|nr:hypothetical protein [Methylobacterium soli]KAB1075419.1 hypothetical protein F6X53_24965 [Methylobacterium soli]GJE41314.1 hypothetical protein AEGHOMDF_0478 [Methylobacterium soli]